MKKLFSQTSIKSISSKWLVVVFMVIMLIFVLIALFVFINWGLIEILYLKSTTQIPLVGEHNLEGINRLFENINDIKG